MSKVHTIPEFKEIVHELKERRENQAAESKFGWYERHWVRLDVENK